MEAEKYFYQKQWEDLRNREAQYKKSRLFSPFIGIFGILALFIFANFSVVAGVVLSVIAVAFIVFMLSNHYKLKNWQCPKCQRTSGNNYFGLHGEYKDRCRYCGLEKWEGSTVTDKGTFWSNT
jgi:hypothetical protein